MKKANQVLYFLREVTIVVIGVLIAVSLGNLKESLENDHYVEKTLEAIENEIKLSQADLDTVLKKHYALIDSLEIYNFDEQQSLGEMISSWGGFQVASIQNASLRFFISNKAELLEFELISKLLEIENNSTLLSTKINRLSDFASEHVNDTTIDAKIKFGYGLVNVMDSEQSLLDLYSKFFDENKANLNNESE